MTIQEKNVEISEYCYSKIMSDTETVDISRIEFSSTVFPTKKDKELWDSLTPEQQIALIRREIQEGIDSGLADPCSIADIIAETKAEKNSQ